MAIGVALLTVGKMILPEIAKGVGKFLKGKSKGSEETQKYLGKSDDTKTGSAKGEKLLEVIALVAEALDNTESSGGFSMKA